MGEGMIVAVSFLFNDGKFHELHGFDLRRFLTSDSRETYLPCFKQKLVCSYEDALLYTPEDFKETKVKGRARFCKGAVRTINVTEEKDGITILKQVYW